MLLPAMVLRTDLLKAGDILLTRGGEKDSKRITLFSAGPYSHAALLINSTMIFESDGGVIGCKRFRDLGRARIGSEVVPIAEIPGTPILCAVFRHPLFQTVSEETFSEALLQEMDASFGKDYSERYRLVKASWLPFGLRHVASWCLFLRERRSLKDKIPGPFCSELVMRVFQRLKLPVFDSQMLPEETSPNDLLNTKRSNLRSVEGCVVSSTDLILTEPDGAKRPREEDLAKVMNADNDPFAIAMREIRLAEDRFWKGMKDLSYGLAQIDKADIQELYRNQMFPAVADFIQKSKGLKKRTFIRRALKLGHSYLASCRALQELKDQPVMSPDEHARRAEVFVEFADSWLRNQALLTSAVSRQLVAQNPGLIGFLIRWKAKRARRNAFESLKGVEKLRMRVSTSAHQS